MTTLNYAATLPVLRVSTASTSSTIDISTQSSFQIAAPYIYTIVGFVGMATNFLVAAIIATSVTMKKRQENNLLLNQSVIDGVSGFFLVLNLTINLNTAYVGVWGDLICRYWVSATPLWSALQASICNIVVITVERYFEIVHPLFHKRHKNRYFVWIMVIFPWLFGAASTVHIAVYKSGISHGVCLSSNNWPNNTAMMANGIFSLCAKYFVPLVIFIYCYSRMIAILKRRSTAVAPRQSINNKKVKNIIFEIY